MIRKQGMYYAKNELYELVVKLGGFCGNPERRPIVCLVESVEQQGLFWAIPLGKVGHRTPEALNRIKRYMSQSDADIRSCYYHIGRTTSDSIFFISDALPITSEYIEDEHTGANKELYIIKNKKLVAELERKLFRILAYENANPNCSRQRITDVKNHLVATLKKMVCRTKMVSSPNREARMRINRALALFVAKRKTTLCGRPFLKTAVRFC